VRKVKNPNHFLSHENNNYTKGSINENEHIGTSSHLYNKNYRFRSDKTSNNVNKFTNNSGYRINNSNSDFFNGSKGFISENRTGKNLKFSFDWDKSKYFMTSNSLFHKEKNKLIHQSEYEDFDKIYNNIFCKVKNFQDGKIKKN